MPDPSSALGRLVANENSTSDLLAFLFDKDPAPLIRTLGLPEGAYRCRREGRAAKSRLDLVVYRADLPVAVLEMKGASSEHGDQLQRYEDWAAKRNPAATLFYCSVDRDDTPRDPWRALGLVELFGAWRSSSDPHAAWLAGEIAGLLRSWDEEADKTIGDAKGWYVPDLVTRRIARHLDGVLREAHPGDDGQAQATRTSPGNPMFLAWRRYPGRSEHAWIGVDVRCKGRGTPPGRMGVPALRRGGDRHTVRQPSGVPQRLEPAARDPVHSRRHPGRPGRSRRTDPRRPRPPGDLCGGHRPADLTRIGERLIGRRLDQGTT
ncbi:PD-(D/E)XK nuclease family protein [Actinoplanes sp. NPDC023801]|uniref:PD-(D/E)XK nuclease family protein n=1 Tax=Actinoplanes sp. NPDC023801 TaxID=3154595 RepID=UPI0033F396CC